MWVGANSVVLDFTGIVWILTNSRYAIEICVVFYSVLVLSVFFILWRLGIM
jgi:hypothetical protein